MTKISRNNAVTHLRRTCQFGLALSLSALAPFAWAESLPAAVHACAVETDPGRRLACFDKVAAQFFAETAPPADGRRGVAAESGANTSTGMAHSDSKSNPAPDPAKEDRSGVGAAPQATTQSSTQKELRHVAAHVASIENWQDAMVLHLDNGQTWEQAQETSADLNLRVGDAVTIDRQLGAYWLAGGRSGEVMKVKLKK